MRITHYNLWFRINSDPDEDEKYFGGGAGEAFGLKFIAVPDEEQYMSSLKPLWGIDVRFYQRLSCLILFILKPYTGCRKSSGTREYF